VSVPVADPAARSRERYRRVALTFAASVAGRGAAGLAALVTVPVMLRYLGAERYGLWAALSSAAAALLFADLGIGNGLLTVLAADSGRDDRAAARRHVSSAFFALLGVAAVLAAALAAVYPFVPWPRLFGATGAVAAREAGPAVLAFAACFLASLPAGVVTRVRLARQEGFANGLWSSAGSFLGLALVLAAIRSGLGLPWLVLALCAGPALALMGQSAALYLVREPWLRPAWSEARPAAAARVMRLGAAFSVLQLSGALAYSSDAFVAGMMLGPPAAARYGVLATLFDLPLAVLILLLTPLWPAYGEALARQDRAWMAQALRRSLLTAAAFGLVVGAGLALLGAPVMRVWAGADMVPGWVLLGLMAVRLLVLSLGQAVGIFLNGARVIRPQLVWGPLMAVSAVAAKVLLAPRLGLAGVVAGGIAAQVAFGLLPYVGILRRALRGEADTPAAGG
jgi:O-antigen/teichoic acid export membrane protein